ncbi:MAG: copper homeostasis protein CutC [Planctomycetota bacterium]
METKPFPVQIEVCIDDAACAQEVVAAGADRLEICSALPLGGLTPTAAVVRKASGAGVPVTAMARLRPGDFVLDEEDIAILRDEISAHLEVSAAGIVVGALTPEGEVDSVALGWLVEACAGRPVTFHRAFDHCCDRHSGLEKIIDSGCQRLLTSGGASTALAGAEEIAKIVDIAGDRLEVIAGGGIRPGSALEVVQKTAVRWLHLSARREAPGPSLQHSPQIPLGSAASPEPGLRSFTDPAIVQKLRQELNPEHW